jgi:hypothetical protein
MLPCAAQKHYADRNASAGLTPEPAACPLQAPDEGRFLKGLAVVDDVAYFGITQWAERQVRDSPSNDCELAAYDLATSSLMWRRKVGGSWRACVHAWQSRLVHWPGLMCMSQRGAVVQQQVGSRQPWELPA